MILLLWRLNYSSQHQIEQLQTKFHKPLEQTNTKPHSVNGSVPTLPRWPRNQQNASRARHGASYELPDTIPLVWCPTTCFVTLFVVFILYSQGDVPGALHQQRKAFRTRSSSAWKSRAFWRCFASAGRETPDRRQNRYCADYLSNKRFCIKLC
jgi:hypothetical protein